MYHLNVAIYLLYKFVIWCGTFDAMAAEMEEQQLEQETDNERKQKAERERKRFANKCQYIIFSYFFSFVFVVLSHICQLHLDTSSHFSPHYLTEGNPNSDKFCETPPDTQLVLNYANNSNPCISSLIAINSLRSKNSEKSKN